jgi:hypothetical protein
MDIRKEFLIAFGIFKQNQITCRPEDKKVDEKKRQNKAEEIISFNRVASLQKSGDENGKNKRPPKAAFNIFDEKQNDKSQKSSKNYFVSEIILRHGKFRAQLMNNIISSGKNQYRQKNQT